MSLPHLNPEKQPVAVDADHNVKYPTMTRAGLFASNSTGHHWGPSLHQTKALLEELIAYQQTITGRDNVHEFYQGNGDTVYAVTIIRHKNDRAFESYHKGKRAYVKDIIEQMGTNRVSKSPKAPPEKSNPEDGARRLVKYLAKKHEDVFLEVAKERGLAVSGKFDDVSQAAMWYDAKVNTDSKIRTIIKHLRARLGNDVFGSFRDMNKIRMNPLFEGELRGRIEWVHAQTARGSYKSREGSDDEDGTTKLKAKGGKRKRAEAENSIEDQDVLKPDSDWSTYYNEMRNFHAKNGHCWVSPKESILLHQWTMDQRKDFEEKKMSTGRKFLLEQVRFPFVLTPPGPTIHPK